VKTNPGKTPLNMYLYDPKTKYKIEFQSNKFRVAVTSEFIREVTGLNISYRVIKKEIS